MRIVRLIRLVRLVKLFKQVKPGDKELDVKTEPSNVGKVLSESTTRRVIVMVLLMLVILPFFDGGLDTDENEVQIAGLVQLTYYQSEYFVEEATMKHVVDLYGEHVKPMHASVCPLSCLEPCTTVS